MQVKIMAPPIRALIKRFALGRKGQEALAQLPSKQQVQVLEQIGSRKKVAAVAQEELNKRLGISPIDPTTLSEVDLVNRSEAIKNLGRTRTAQGKLLEMGMDEQGRIYPITPQQEIDKGIAQMGGVAPSRSGGRRHPRTGALLPAERPWSDYHNKKYDDLIREVREEDPYFNPSPEEERALQREVTRIIDSESKFPDKFTRVAIPGSKARSRIIRSDVGSPATAMLEQMRGRGYGAGQDISPDLLQQRMTDPHAASEVIPEEIWVRPDEDKIIESRMERAFRTPSKKKRHEGYTAPGTGLSRLLKEDWRLRKQGGKVVNRKRGGMVKPRGWGAARYKER